MASVTPDILSDSLYGIKNDSYTFDILGRNKFGKPASLNPNTSPRDSFYTMIEQWAFSLPLKSEWMLYIDNIPLPVSGKFLTKFEGDMYNVKQDPVFSRPVDELLNKFNVVAASGGHTNILPVIGGDGKKKGKNIFERISDRAEEVGNLFSGDGLMDKLGEFTGRDQKYTSSAGASIFGCRFVENISGIPGESSTHDYVPTGIKGGFLGAHASTSGRAGYEKLRITFKETNTSFPDFVVRPWIQAVAHHGLIAPKDPINKLTTTLQLIQYARSVNGKPTPARKHWIFFNACPVVIHSEEADYSTDGGWPTKISEWIFTHYVVINYDNNDDIMKYQTPRGPSWFERFIPGSVSSAVDSMTGQENTLGGAVGDVSPI